MKYCASLVVWLRRLAGLFYLLLAFCLQAGLPEPWRFVNSLPQGNDLRCVWMVDTNQVFVGGDGGVILRWNGTQWERLATPTEKTVMALHGLSATDVWAVGGDAYTLDQTNRSLLLHFNGTAWQSFPSPQFSGYTYMVTSVHAVAPNDVWATLDSGTYVLHWDGAAWQFFNIPLLVEGRFNAIASVGTEHLFFVGTHGQIVHRDHNQWVLEQKTETNSGGGGFTFDILLSIWGSDLNHVYAGGNWGQLYSRITNGNWTKIELGGTVYGGDNQIKYLWGASPTQLYLLGGFGLRQFDLINTPTRLDFTNQKRGQWLAGCGLGSYFIGVGGGGTVHEVILDAPGGAAISALTVGSETHMPISIRGATRCGSTGLLVYGGASQTSPLWYFDGVMGYPVNSLPEAIKNEAQPFVLDVVSSGLNDVLLVYSSLASFTSGVNRWDGSAWSTIGSSWTQPMNPLALWRSPAGKIYAMSGSGVKVTDGTNDWEFVLAFDQIPAGRQLTAIAGRSDAEIYVGTDNGVVLRYDGLNWNQESLPANGYVRALAANATDLYAIGYDGLACRRVGASWQQLSGVDARQNEPFQTLVVANDGVYAAQTTDAGVTGGGKGRLWRFNGGTATLVIKELSQPLLGLAKTAAGTKFGFSSGAFIITDGSAPAGMAMQRVNLMDTNAWISLGNTGAAIRPAQVSASRPMVAAWRLDQTNEVLRQDTNKHAGGQEWVLLQEVYRNGNALPPVFVQLHLDSQLLPSAYNPANLVQFRHDNTNWLTVPSSLNQATMMLTSTAAANLSMWTFGSVVIQPASIKLLISRQGSRQVRLTWPASAANYQLESQDLLSVIDAWSPINNPVSVSNDQSSVTLDIGVTKQFLRLKKP